MLRLLLTGLMALVFTGCVQQGSTLSTDQLSDTPTYGRFVWHDLLTDDLEGAKAFYGELLGWQFEATTRPGGGPYTLILTDSGRVVGGMLEVEDPGDGRDYSRWLGYYAVPDVDAATEAVVRSGGQTVVSPREVGDAARVSAVQDADGAVVGLLTSRIGYPIQRPTQVPGEIAWNELVTAEPERLADFYASLVAGDVSEEARGEFTYRFLEKDGQPAAGVMLRPNDQIEPLWLTYFAVADVEAASARVANLGGERLVAPDTDIRDGRVALVTDPSGAVLGLMERK